MHFLEWKLLYFDLNFTEICFHGSNYLICQHWFRYYRTGDKPLSEPMMVSLPTHICLNELTVLLNRILALVGWWKHKIPWIVSVKTCIKHGSAAVMRNPQKIMMTSSNGNIFRVTGHLCGEFKGHGRGALMISLICAWIKGWVNNGEAGDLRRYRAHYDITVMWFCITAAE